MKQNYIFILILVLLASSCFNSKNKKETWLSGEIMGPASKYVILYKDRKVVDTLPLDENNRFCYLFPDDMEEGIFTFRHDYGAYYETQMFFIEKGDSLQFLLNSSDFDESLMYSGKGAIANNYLMLLFLEKRQNNKLPRQYYKTGPEDFTQKTDSIRWSQNKSLKQLKDQGDITDKFYDFAKSVIQYSSYDLREHYLYLANKYKHNYKWEITPEFLAYRDSTDMNDASLQNYYIYQYFLIDCLRNLTVEKCLSDSDGRDCFDLNTRANRIKRIKITDSLIKLPGIRSRILTRIGARLIVDSKVDEDVDWVLDYMENLPNYDEMDLERIRLLASVHKRQFIGNVADLNLMGPGQNQIKIGDLLTHPTVFFFWSIRHERLLKYQSERIQAIQNQFPDLNYVGVNIDNKVVDLKDADIQEMYRKYPFLEYRVVYPSDQMEFYRDYVHKQVLVGTNGEIIDNGLNIRDNNFENELSGLLSTFE